MPDRTSKPKRPRDTNVLAKRIVDEATGDAPQPAGMIFAVQPSPKNPHAQALGSLGGKKGGPARAKKLTAARRSAIARKAAKARWAKKPA